MVGVYKITNLMNGKKYIGQSVDIRKRWNKHKTSPFNPNCDNYDCPLYRAIRKYGIDSFSFSFEIVEECLIEELNEKEIFWISSFDTTNVSKGYNLTLGGHHTSPKVLSFEDIDEIIFLLQTTKLSQYQIANEFDISQRMVSSINLGQSWKKDGFIYPIRREFILKKEDNQCSLCGKVINRGAIHCTECSHLMSRKVSRPSREILKDKIRSFSFVALGKEYGVSDTAIRKWCKQYNLPHQSSKIKQFSNAEWNLI